MITPFVQLYFTLEPPRERLPPYALFAIRQQFHADFRRAAGCFHDLQDCCAGSDCPCRSVFDQQLATDPAALRLYQKPPLPFAFKIPILPEKTGQDHEIELSLMIVGESIRYLDLFVKATLGFFAPAGSLSNWRVLRVAAAGSDGSRTALPLAAGLGDFPSLPLLSFDDLIAGGGSCSRISLNIESPLRLIHQGSVMRELPFSRVAGALFRRISALTYYYGGEELPHDFRWLAMQSQKIVCKGADLRWVNRGGVLQGLEGTLLFRGGLTEFMPFLQLGSLLNIGKGAAYGMGSYSISKG
jgi:hypothetical protein